MRSSKSRSRSKNNRNRSVGNILNRVFDSSGPEGKVRGTPQQIIDKYNQLARDAQLANDRVATENFQQHAEHYTRLLTEAQREAEARREQHEQQQGRDRQRDDQSRHGDQPRHTDQSGRDGDQDDGQQNEQRGGQQGAQPEPQERRRGDGGAEVAQAEAAPEALALDGPAESGLVETPESAPKPKRPRRPRKPRAAAGDKAGGDSDGSDTSSGAAPPAAAE